MSKENTGYKRIRVILPSVTSFEVEYESLEDLKKKVCERLEIEPELTNLIFVDRDEDLEPIDTDDIGDLGQKEYEGKPRQDVIVDYLWSRQMISLGDKQKQLRKADALIVGAGALGNEIVKNLAYLGFGKITVVDFDSVEYSNVSRGLFEFSDIGKNKAEVLAKKMGEKSPYTEIKSISARVEECEEEQLKSQVIISALDNMTARIWLAAFCVKNKTPLVDGGIREFSGRIQTYIPDGPCLACSIPLDRYGEIMELANPCEGLDYDAVASFSSVASIVGGIQANEAMKIVCGLPTLKGALILDLLNNKYSVLPLKKNLSCFVCGEKSVH
jgi:molybdopterin/thiamine biosynthesis adenylyltransferase